MAERDLPDLVARLRLVFDDTGVKQAKKATAALEGDLTKSAEDRKFDAWMEQTRRRDARRLAKKNRASEVLGADSDASAERTLSTYARTSLALAGIGAAYNVARVSLKAYLEEGKRGAFIGTEEQEQYEKTAANLDRLSKKYQEAKSGLGGFVAKAVSPETEKGLRILGAVVRDPRNIVDVVRNRYDPGLRRKFADIDSEVRAAQDRLTAAARSAAVIRNLSAEGKAQEVLNKAQAAQVGLSRSLESATLRVAGAQNTLADAHQRVASAQDAVADAHRRVADAAFDVADAEDDLREAQFRQGVGSEEAIKAARALERARLNQADARSGVGEAGRALADAQAGVGEAARALAEGNANLVDANTKLNANIWLLNGTIEKLIPKLVPEVLADTGNLLRPGVQQVNNFNGITDHRALAQAMNQELDWATRAPGRRAV